MSLVEMKALMAAVEGAAVSATQIGNGGVGWRGGKPGLLKGLGFPLALLNLFLTCMPLLH